MIAVKAFASLYECVDIERHQDDSCSSLYVSRTSACLPTFSTSAENRTATRHNLNIILLCVLKHSKLN